MKRTIATSFLLLSLSLLTTCGVVPISGRRQLNLVPESQIIAQSSLAYSEFVAAAPICRDTKATARVEAICKRITKAADTYLRANGAEQLASQMKWQYVLVSDRRANAFCMPGGKIAVFTGILKLCDSDDELATVISHEVSHAIARHSNERLSGEILRQLGGQILSAATGNQSSITRQVINQAYGLGSQVAFSLPYSRAHETEADKIGLVFMALAGYNPHAAVSFWQKMADASGGEPLQLLSTHPSHASRIKNIEAFLPKAMEYYKK